MSFASILLLAVGLAMDATAVAAARGLAAERVRVPDALRLAALFGIFQGAMPLLGWLAGDRFGAVVTTWEPWIVFVLLSGIGARMLWDALHPTQEAPQGDFQLRTLLVLAIATSIDALAAGVTLPLLRAPLGLTLATIAAVTFALSLGGVYAGRYFGARLGAHLDALGGIVLIGLGVRTLVQHLLGRG